ncbi:hypothetical protein Q8F55_002950 [Vanrija albida]|uniref:Ketoreductase domain-containing protein n=1 Tax=Vanrija albida TaxID=181172 RepID=A0ABR3QBC2_9TREE
MPRLEGKIALVTGAASGIGRAVVAAFLKHGAKVVTIDLHTPEVPEDAFPLTTDLEHVEGDVRDPHTWAIAFSTAKANYGAHPNILVNNAGVLRNHSLADMSEDDWDVVFGTNFVSALKGSQQFIRYLLDEGRPGAIVNVSSIAGERVFPNATAYNISKAALSHLTRVAAAEYADKGIRVNAVAPGNTVTGMTRTTTYANAEAASKLMAHTPIKRWATADEVASSIVYLASDDASYVTGAVLPVDGGYVDV